MDYIRSRLVKTYGSLTDDKLVRVDPTLTKASDLTVGKIRANISWKNGKQILTWGDMALAQGATSGSGPGNTESPNMASETLDGNISETCSEAEHEPQTNMTNRDGSLQSVHLGVDDVIGSPAVPEDTSEALESLVLSNHVSDPLPNTQSESQAVLDDEIRLMDL